MAVGPEVEARPLANVPRGADGRIDLDGILAAAHGLAQLHGAGDPATPRLLESVPGTPGTGRWSYVVVGTRGRLLHRPDRGSQGSGVLADVRDTSPFAALDHACEVLALHPHGPAPSGPAPPFRGGLVGGFSYDLSRGIEDVPSRAATDRDLPWIDLAVADLVVAVDHRDDAAVLLHRPAPGQPRTHDELGRVVQLLAQAPPTGPRAPAPPTTGVGAATTSRDRADYLAAVEAVLEHIAAGDAFQVNLSQRLTSRWAADPPALYRALRDVSPAPYGAIVPCGDHAVASISPETFLQVDRGAVTVRPIKGTRPRHPDPAEDGRLRAELAASEKDRAENVMVVDMERNDLGRVCVPGSVRAPALCEVEGHPTVWHLVSTVTGRLRDEVGYAELLRATFPCGSVTGTPKVRAMQLIDRYEPVRRGWYCGALGFVGDGAASLSVAIRTAILAPDGTVDYGAGGGIVADSRPEAEYDESLAKAAAFLQAVGAQPPRQDHP